MVVKSSSSDSTRGGVGEKAGRGVSLRALVRLSGVARPEVVDASLSSSDLSASDSLDGSLLAVWT